MMYRSLKDRLPALKGLSPSSMIVLCGPSWKLPAELQHEIPVLQFDLPSRDQLATALQVVAKDNGVKVEDEASILDAAAGLCLSEAENALALSLVENKGKLQAATVEGQKMRLVKSSGFLEVSLPADPADIGGLGSLKSYFADEVLPSMHDQQLMVKGVLLVGVPGTGKSLAARAAGAMLGWPVLRLDMSALKAGIVGASEGNLRQALKLADAIAPCVLWIDEIEKAVGGFASSAQTDGGTTLGMVGQLLTWLQEHKSPVITVATCNDYAKLPAELTRAGRFDERFFVDLPSFAERVEIAGVHLGKYLDSPNGLREVIAKLAEGWTGAEIESLVISAARRTGRQVTIDALQDAAKNIKPISKVKGDEIRSLRAWAADTLRYANTVEAQLSKGRTIAKGDDDEQ